MNEFTNTKILIVGGAGFVGSNLVKKLLESSPARTRHCRQPALGGTRSMFAEHEAVTFIEGLDH